MAPTRLCLQFWMFWIVLLPWMNAGQHPAVPITLDPSRSIFCHLADTAHFLHSDPCPSLAFTLVSQALGVSSSLSPSLWTLGSIVIIPCFFLRCPL